MRIRDLHELPKFRDGLSYLYLEHCRIDQSENAIACRDLEGLVKIPCASLSLIMLGPGTSITHEAIKTIADNGCLVIWCGEEGVRFYAHGSGETRSSRRLLFQAEMCIDPIKRLEVVKRMYQIRFKGEEIDGLTVDELRGKEGIRVRGAYYRASKKYGVEWYGRNYERKNWSNADPVNRALSAANSCLYGLCHAAIVSLGYSPGLGFIHTGKQLSFVYDVADLYKTDLCIPIAFEKAVNPGPTLERDVRIRMRDLIRENHLLSRIVDDIETILDIGDDEELSENDYDSDAALPGPLWNYESVKTGKPC
ncbi:MAG: type I-E CRISPR-associated endonuclease Cas1 [Methanomassiliicoccales archaeon]|nr:MAG: type I-E CRISPR-associated endonuclease Cas1 [Methanomassiliicoccales archaeon]